MGSGAAKVIGYFLGVVLILQYVSSGSIWMLGACRVQAVAALDGSAPRILGKFSKQGTPAAMAILSGIVSSVMCVIVFLVTSGSLKEFIGVMIALDTSLTVVVYVFVIPAIVRLRTTHPHVHRPFVVPGGAVGLWACAAITWILSVITCITLLWPGLLNNMLGQSYSISDNWGMSRLRFELMDLGTFVVLLLIAVGFWAYGRTQGTVAENAVIEGVVEEERDDAHRQPLRLRFASRTSHREGRRGLTLPPLLSSLKGEGKKAGAVPMLDETCGSGFSRDVDLTASSVTLVPHSDLP